MKKLVRKKKLKRGTPPGKSKPVKWNDDRCRQAFELGKIGATDDDMARVMNVSVHTITYWKRTKEEFREALKKGKFEFDQQVVKAAHHRAIGYSHDDVQLFPNRVKEYKVDPKTGRRYVEKEYTDIIKVPIIKHYPPDTKAIIFWLTNRRREEWSSIKKVDVQGNINLKNEIDFDNLNDKELEFIEAMGRDKIEQLLNPDARYN